MTQGVYTQQNWLSSKKSTYYYKHARAQGYCPHGLFLKNTEGQVSDNQNEREEQNITQTGEILTYIYILYRHMYLYKHI